MDKFSFNDTLNNAAELQAFLGYPNWLTFIGVGEADGKPCIYLYVNRNKHIPRSDIPDTWRGIPVKVQRIGKIRPA